MIFRICILPIICDLGNLEIMSCFASYFTVPCVVQSALLHSQPKSTVGTPAYIAPEILSRKEYDGKVPADSVFFLLLSLLTESFIDSFCFFMTNQ